MEDLGCAVVWCKGLWSCVIGRLRMRSGKYATGRFSLWSRIPALQTISDEALITYYSRKYDLCVRVLHAAVWRLSFAVSSLI